MKWLRVLHILAISLILAAYSAWASPSRERSSAEEDLTRCAHAVGITTLGLEDVETLWHDKSVVFLDIRRAYDFDVGHIEGAINLPEEEIEQGLAGLKAQLKEARHIVVYCSSMNCEKSLRSAIQLHKEGLTQTKVYLRGFNEWYLRGLPIQRKAGLR